MRFDRFPIAPLDRSGQLKAVVDRPSHERDECLRRSTRGAKQVRGDVVQRHEIVRGDRGTGVVERARVVGKRERLESEHARQPEAVPARLVGLRRHRAVGVVELLRPLRAREGLQGMNREAARMRIERRERRGA